MIRQEQDIHLQLSDLLHKDLNKSLPNLRDLKVINLMLPLQGHQCQKFNLNPVLTFLNSLNVVAQTNIQILMP